MKNRLGHHPPGRFIPFSQEQHINRLTVCMILLLAAGIGMLPFIIERGAHSDDTVIHINVMQLAAQELGRGHLFMRWLEGANGGYGSPMPNFYFPFYYHIGALFYPFALMGLPHLMLACTMGLALLVSGIGVWRLAGEECSGRVRLLLSLLYMFLPYHLADICISRIAPAEAWAMAWFPFMLAETRKLGEARASSFPLATYAALAMFSHLPISALGMAACCCMALIMPDRRWLAMARMVRAFLLAVLLTAPFWVRVFVYHDAIDRDSSLRPEAYPNLFIDSASLIGRGYILVYAETLVIALYAGWIGWRRRLPWIILALLALSVIMAWKWSAFLWPDMLWLRRAFFPWRLQGLTCLLVVWLMAIAAQRSKRGNIVMHLKNMLGLSVAAYAITFIATIQSPPFFSDEARRETVRLVNFMESRTIWMPPEIYDAMPESLSIAYDERVEKADAQPGQFRVQMAEPGDVTLPMIYFPFWRAVNEAGALPLEPDERTGLARVTLPAGEHVIRMQQAYSPAEKLAYAASVITAAGMLACVIIRNRHRKRRAIRT